MAWFQSGVSPVPRWGVWQKPQTSDSAVALMVPGPLAERSCLEARIVSARVDRGDVMSNRTPKKLQPPNSKLQRNFKFQTPNFRERAILPHGCKSPLELWTRNSSGAWTLGFGAFIILRRI